jgi:hypothetical protein
MQQHPNTRREGVEGIVGVTGGEFAMHVVTIGSDRWWTKEKACAAGGRIRPSGLLPEIVHKSEDYLRLGTITKELKGMMV